jgi:hypothetical protein
MRWKGHVAYMGEKKGIYRVLMGRTEGKRPLGIHKLRWEDNIKTNLQNVKWGSDLAQDRDRWRDW